MTKEEQLREIALRELAEEELANEEKAQASSGQAPVQQAQPEATIEPEIGAAMSTANPMLDASIEQIVPTDEARKAQGYGAIEGIPFAKDIISSTLTMAQGGTENFSERKRANQKQWDNEYNRYMQRYPYATLEGDFTSSALAFGALGVAFPFTTGVAASVSLGGLSGYSRTQDRENIGDVGMNVSIGIVGGALPYAIGGGAKLIGRGAGIAKTGLSRLSKGVDLLNREVFKEMSGIVNSNTMKKASSHFSKTAGANKSLQEAEQEGIARLMNYTTQEGTPVIGSSKDYSKINMNASIEKANRGKQLESIVKKIDDGDFEKVAANDLEEILLDKVLKKGNNLSEADQAYNAQVVDKVKSILKKSKESEKIVKQQPVKKTSSVVDSSGKPMIIDEVVDVVEYKEIPYKYSAKDLHKAKLDSASELKFQMDGSVNTDRAHTAVHEAMRETANEILQEASDKYKQVNLEWSDLNLLEDISAEAFKYQKSGSHKYVKAVYKAGATLTRGETVKSNITKANAVVVGLDAMMNSEGFNPEMTPRIQRIKDFVSVSPDSVYTKRMIMAAAISDNTINTNYDAVNDTIEAVSAELALMESPIKRNINDIKMKSDLILDIVDFYSPMQADALRDALDNRDDETVRVMMDQVSKMPEVSQIFEGGKGIDGRVYSEEDKQALRDEVEGMDISLKQKLQHLDQLNKAGVIPQVQEEPDRFFQPKWRDKSKPRY